MNLQTALTTIQNFIDQQQRNNAENISQIVNEGLENLDDPNRKAIIESVKTISKAVKLLKDGEGVDIFCGVLIVLSGVATLNPTTGSLAASLLQLSSTVIDAFCGNGNKVGAAVMKSINQALEKFADDQLQEKSAGTENAYRTSFAFLRGIQNTLNNDEISAVLASVPIYAGVEFLGILKCKIKKLRNSNDKNEVSRAIEYIKMYAKLAILRKGLIQILYTRVFESQGCDGNIAKAISNVIDNDKKSDKTFLKFLTRPEDHSQKLLLSYFYPSTMRSVVRYLRHLGLNSESIDTQYAFQFQTDHYKIGLTRSYWFNPFSYGYVASMNDMKAEYSFQLEVILEDDSLYYILSNDEPYMYIYMANSPSAQCYASKSQPGPEGQWKVIKFKDGGCIISSKRWPEWFLKGDMETNAPNIDVGYASDTINYSLKGYYHDYSIFRVD